MDDRLEEHDDIIEIIVEYKKGFYSKQNAIRQLVKLGFEPGISEAMLRAMKKDNVVDIRGYVKTPEQLKRGHDAWVKKIKGCGQGPTEVETDNK